MNERPSALDHDSPLRDVENLRMSKVLPSPSSSCPSRDDLLPMRETTTSKAPDEGRGLAKLTGISRDPYRKPGRNALGLYRNPASVIRVNVSEASVNE